MPITWMVIVLIMVSGAVYVFKSCRDLPVETIEKTTKLVNDLGQQLEKVAEAFNRGTITTTFTSYATTLSGSEYFQFATLTQQETFTRKDESSTGFGYIPLPDVIVEASAPVTYTYYLDLNARWDFRLQDGVIYVIAPDIKYNKPAVDATGSPRALRTGRTIPSRWSSATRRRARTTDFRRRENKSGAPRLGGCLSARALESFTIADRPSARLSPFAAV